jgi:tetratricopeptide (TPR) repeat protein
LLALVLLVGAAGGVALWQWWRGSPPPLPEVALDGYEPAVVKAVEAARADVIREPRSGAAWGKLAQVLLAHHFDDAALACCAAARRYDPKNPRWPYYQGLVTVLRDPAAAAPLFQRAADLGDTADPENPTPRLWLAETLLQLNRPADARAEFRRVLTRQPGNPRANFGMGRATAAADDLEAARGWFANCSAHPQSRKKATGELAKVLRRLGQDSAADAAERQARGLPTDLPWPDRYASEFGALGVSTESRLHRVKLLEMDGRFPEAVEVLRQTVRDVPSYRAYVALGLAQVKVKDNAGAEAALREAMRLGPDKFEAPHLLAVMRIDQARLIEADPNARPQARELYRQAAELDRQALAVKPDDALGQMFLGLALKGLGQRQEALAAFRAAVRGTPDRPEPYLTLAEALADEGHKDEARRMLEEATRRAAPNDPRLRPLAERLGQASAKP